MLRQFAEVTCGARVLNFRLQAAFNANTAQDAVSARWLARRLRMKLAQHDRDLAIARMHAMELRHRRRLEMSASSRNNAELQVRS